MADVPKKKSVNWIMMGLILIAVLLVMGYDPLTALFGAALAKLIVAVAVIVAIFYSPLIDRYMQNRRQ